MNSSSKIFQETLTRRQFGLLLGGGAILVAAGGTYGVIANSERNGPAETSFTTPFGMVIVHRAGRFSRLDEQGRKAASNLTLAAAHFGGQGGVRASRQVTQIHGNAPVFDSHGHSSGDVNPDGRQPVNATWADVVALEVEVRNESGQPVLFSPGQLRLKLRSSDVTVTPQDSDHSPGVITAHTNEYVLISYLAPDTWAEFELEFADDVHQVHERLPLQPLTTTAVLS